MGNLDKLENLNFSNNQLTGSIPPELGSMRSLAGLNLSNNRLSGSIPSELGNLPVIRWFLDLSSNELSGSIPQSLGSLSRLRELYLHDNKLSGLVPLSLSRLEVLETLRLDGTNLCVFPDGEFQAWLEGIPNLSLPPACDNRDMGVLVSLYNATNGSNWTHSDGWLNRPNLNDWFGVTVNADGRVTRVSLSNNSLSGTLPLELGYLDQLTELHLNVNNLSGSIPESFGNLTLLRSLNLSHNLKLQGPLPIEMIDLSNLNTLMLEGTDLCVLPDPDMQAWLDGIPGGNVHPCQIHDRDALIALYEATNGPGWGNNSGWTDAVSLGDWYGVGVDYQGRVTAIDLSRNGLSGQLPRVLGALSELQFLRLDKNKLTGHIPSELADLNELTHILLNENQLSGPIPPELGNLNKLTHLSLSENQLSGPIPPELVSLNDLNKLILHNNRLSGPIPPDLGVLDQLTELSLYNNELTGPVPSELGRLTGLTKLPLHDNQLSGPVPAELGNLSELMELTLYNNPDLSGPIPGSLTNLDLKVLQLGGTQLCAPQTPKFSEWLLGIPDQRVAICTASMNVRAYLVQAVQSLDHPVPLIAGERALLRVFLTANGEVEIRMPKVRANFYLDDVLVHTDEIPGKETVIPAEIEEGSLSSSAIAEVPATVIQPGLEMVIEVDPDGTLDPVYGVSGRFPETGSYEVDVASVPPLNLTVVPFLWRENPDLSVLSKTGGLTSQDELFWQTRYLLPVYDPDFTVTVRDYVWTSVDPVFENISSIIRETRAIQMADGAKNHYMGVLRDIVGGQTTLRGTVSAVPLSGETIAHELGHNMSLEHAPCCFLCLGLSGVDPHYPYSEGNIGAWGYDFTGLYLLSMAGLVRPRESDLMSYCGSRWISDYHFTKALRYRVTEEVDNIYGTVASNRSLLLWGGVDENGDLVLEPAFVVDTTPSWPSAPRPYRLTGEDRNGHVLFELGFDIYEYAHGDGGSFAFAIPVDSSWPDRLSRITLSGPAGAVSIDGQGESAMGLLTDSVTGQVRGFHRDLQDDEGGISARRVLPEPSLDVVISRGVPEPGDW